MRKQFKDISSSSFMSTTTRPCHIDDPPLSHKKQSQKESQVRRMLRCDGPVRELGYGSEFRVSEKEIGDRYAKPLKIKLESLLNNFINLNVKMNENILAYKD